MDTPDPSTLVLHASQPWPAIFNVLAWTNLIDPQTPPEQNKPVGSGPFSLVEWGQGDPITLKKNPNYWQSGKPYLDGVEIKIFADPQSMSAQLEGGAIDVATPAVAPRRAAAGQRPEVPGDLQPEQRVG